MSPRGGKSFMTESNSSSVTRLTVGESRPHLSTNGHDQFHFGTGLRVALVTAAVVAVLGIGFSNSAAGRLLMPLVGLAGVAILGYIAVTRFEAFILTVLVVRSALDLTKTTDTGASVMDPASLLALLMIGASLMWLLVSRHKRIAHTWTPFSIGIVGLGLASMVSLLGTNNLLTSISEALRIISGVLMFLVCDRLLAFGTSKKSFVWVIAAAGLVPLLMGVVGPLLNLNVTHVKDGVIALHSTFHLSNAYAHFLLPYLVVGAALWLHARGWKSKAALGAVLAVAAVEMLFTQTRGAWIGLGLALLLVAILDRRWVGIFATVAVAVALLLSPLFAARIVDLGQNPDQPRQTNSWEWRVEHWGQIIPLVDGRPLTGIGAGMTLEESPNEKEPHNDYILALVELGAFGIVTYLVVVGGFIYVSFRALRRTVEGWERGLLLGIAAYSVAFAAVSLAENLVTSVAFLWYVMPLAAIAHHHAYRRGGVAAKRDEQRVAQQSR